MKCQFVWPRFSPLGEKIWSKNAHDCAESAQARTFSICRLSWQELPYGGLRCPCLLSPRRQAVATLKCLEAPVKPQILGPSYGACHFDPHTRFDQRAQGLDDWRARFPKLAGCPEDACEGPVAAPEEYARYMQEALQSSIARGGLAGYY